MRLRVLAALAMPVTAALVVGILVGTYIVGPLLGLDASGATRTPAPQGVGLVGLPTASPGASGADRASGQPVGSAKPRASGRPGSPSAAGPSAASTTVPPAKEGVVPILYYHRVEGLPAGFASWSKKSQDTFLVDDLMPFALTAQLDWLKSHGYTTILPRDLAGHWDSGKPLPARPIVLTFDDGFKNWVTLVLPELKKRGMVAEFYVTLSNIGRSITWADVKALAKAGMGIGAHDVHHTQIAGAGINTSAATMRYEVSEAKRQLEQQTGVTVDSMAYMGGGYNATLMSIVQEAGYTTARAIDRGVQQSPAIRFRLHVSRVSWKDDVTNIYTGTMAAGLPMFGARVSGANPG